jgi:hypothetical protein
VALCTPWPAYAAIDFTRLKRAMRGDLVLDGRNVLDPETVRASGLRYEGIGRGVRRAATPETDPEPTGRLAKETRVS